MELLFFCPHWGSEHLQFTSFLQKVKDAGFDGIEMSLPMNDSQRQYTLNALREYDLKLIAQHWETVDRDFSRHKTKFAERIKNLASGNPLFINSQTGKDYYTMQQNVELMQLAQNVAADYGVEVIHETHRGKWSFAAHITHQYLQRHPFIRLTLDVSHWCTVAETFLHDQPEALDLAIEHSDHIHARVGYTEGPQVSDPRAPEWAEALNHHLKWWDKVIYLKLDSGAKAMTITPEFGAPPYLPMLPYTRQPLVSQWECNVYMMELLKERYLKKLQTT